jgi:hypothetical protein
LYLKLASFQTQQSLAVPKNQRYAANLEHLKDVVSGKLSYTEIFERVTEEDISAKETKC